MATNTHAITEELLDAKNNHVCKGELQFTAKLGNAMLWKESRSLFFPVPPVLFVRYWGRKGIMMRQYISCS
jgi:hypothetical protein